jgi:transposase
MQVEVVGEEIKAETMDHHGLVAATCKDLKIAERIDNILYQDDTGRVVKPGESVVAMILNGLGFTNRRLYIMDQFFENKPLEKLIAPGLDASNITYDTLANTLDDISQYGETELFSRVAIDIALENRFLGPLNHIDTTSISVEGDYDVPEEDGVIKITQGHSKDHRPDLKQLMLSLVVTGESNFPLWMEALDGNSSDKVNFHETIAKVQSFQSQLDLKSSSKWVADSAFYTKKRIQQAIDYIWLSRVPETIKEAQELVKKDESDITWVERDRGYKTAIYKRCYGNVDQRWLLVYSEQGYQRERKTLDRKIDKLEAKYIAECKKFECRQFACVADAEDAFRELMKGKRFFQLEGDVIAIKKHKAKGRPKAGVEKEVVGYQVQVKLSRDDVAIKMEANKKGRFILATNDLNEADYPDQEMLREYKSQQKVENGFRFLKDPWFMLNSVFLKRPNRVSALMMVMTLCLMVYNVAEYRLRKSLKAEKETLPNQKGKEIDSPTLRWVFQLMEGINIVRFYDGPVGEPVREIIINITDLRAKIIRLFGYTACEVYGLIDEKPVHPLRM